MRQIGRARWLPIVLAAAAFVVPVLPSARAFPGSGSAGDVPFASPGDSAGHLRPGVRARRGRERGRLAHRPPDPQRGDGGDDRHDRAPRPRRREPLAPDPVRRRGGGRLGPAAGRPPEHVRLHGSRGPAGDVVVRSARRHEPHLQPRRSRRRRASAGGVVRPVRPRGLRGDRDPLRAGRPAHPAHAARRLERPRLPDERRLRQPHVGHARDPDRPLSGGRDVPRDPLRGRDAPEGLRVPADHGGHEAVRHDRRRLRRASARRLPAGASSRSRPSSTTTSRATPSSFPPR